MGDRQGSFDRQFGCRVPGYLGFLLAVLASSALVGCAHMPEIHEASAAGDLLTVHELVKNHPELVFNTDVPSGETPLHLAAGAGHRGVVQLLLANHADVNARTNKGVTPLYTAALNGNRDVAESLLAFRANVNAETNDGWTPLHAAVVYGYGDVATLLRENGGHE